jgi:hypothetical protein
VALRAQTRVAGREKVALAQRCEIGTLRAQPSRWTTTPTTPITSTSPTRTAPTSVACVRSRSVGRRLLVRTRQRASATPAGLSGLASKPAPGSGHITGGGVRCWRWLRFVRRRLLPFDPTFQACHRERATGAALGVRRHQRRFHSSTTIWKSSSYTRRPGCFERRSRTGRPCSSSRATRSHMR